jgi:hypothetical protein
MEPNKVESLLRECDAKGISRKDFAARLQREAVNEQQRYNKPTPGDLFPGLRKLKQ